jgi:hypothetical protein
VVQELAGAVGGVAVHGGPISPSVLAGLPAAALAVELGSAPGTPGLGPPGSSGLGGVLLVALRPALAAAPAAGLGGRGCRGALRAVGTRCLVVVGELAGGRALDEVADEALGRGRAPELPGVTAVSVMISLSGSMAMWPL